MRGFAPLFKCFTIHTAFCVVVLAANTPAHAEKRVALVIGNGAYTNTARLPNPKNDAEDVSAALGRAGFETVVGLDLDKVGMDRAVVRFARAARDADIALFYYSGHAMQFGGVNYLMPVDAKLTDEADLRLMARLDDIVADLQRAKNLRIMVLDSCRDNPLAEELKRSIGRTRDAGIGRGLAKIDSPQGMIVAYATQAGRTADDGTGRNSPYTTAFLKHFEAPEEIGTIFRRISGDVYETTKRRQLPELSLSVIGEFYLRGKPQALALPAPPNPVPAIDINAEMRRDYELAAQIGTKQAWDMFLENYPKGFHANLARAAREKILASEKAEANANAAKVRAEAAEEAKAANAEAERAKAEAAKAAAAKAERERIEASDRAKAEATKAAIAEADRAKEAARLAAAKAERDRIEAAKVEAAREPTPREKPQPQTKIATAIDQLPAKVEIASFCRPNPSRQVDIQPAIGGPLVQVAMRPNLTTAKEIRAIALSPDGTRYATAGDDRIVRLWDTSTFRLAGELRGHSAEIYSVAYSSDGRLLASTGWDGSVRIWNTGSGALVHTFQADGAKGPVRQFGVAFYPRQDSRYVNSVGTDGQVWIWNVQNRVLDRKRVSHKDGTDLTVRSVAFAPNVSGEFVSAGFDGSIKFFLETGRIESVKAHTGKVLHVSYSPSGNRVASAGVDKEQKTLKVWNAASRTLFRSYEGHKDYVVAAAWSKDGKTLASGGGARDRTVRLWDVESGRQLQMFVGHAADIEGVAFHPNRNWLVSVSEDKTMKVWDIAGGKELLTIAAFEDGQYLAHTPTGCYTGSANVQRYVKFVAKDVKGPEQDLTDQVKNTLFVPVGAAAVLLGN